MLRLHGEQSKGKEQQRIRLRNRTVDPPIRTVHLEARCLKPAVRNLQRGILSLSKSDHGSLTTIRATFAQNLSETKRTRSSSMVCSYRRIESGLFCDSRLSYVHSTQGTVISIYVSGKYFNYALLSAPNQTTMCTRIFAVSTLCGGMVARTQIGPLLRLGVVPHRFHLRQKHPCFRRMVSINFAESMINICGDCGV